MTNEFLLGDDNLNTIADSYESYINKLEEQSKLIDKELETVMKKRIEKEKEIASLLQLYRSILIKLSKYDNSIADITNDVNKFIDEHENEEVELEEYDEKIKYVNHEIEKLKEKCIKNIANTINPEILDTMYIYIYYL